MATQAGDMVKLEAVASTKSIPRATRLEEFAVQVRVTAAPGPVRARAGGVDLVAVLDVSGSMNEDNGLERMKRAMDTVIDQLGSDDRLSLVTFSDEVQRLTELCVMSDDNRGKARAEVSKLTAALGTRADAKAVSEEAARILAQRGEKDQSNRAGRIIFLSNGNGGDDDDTDDDDDDDDAAVPGQGQSSATTESSPEPSDDDDEEETHPVLEQELTATEAFGLGADDCLSALSYGAEQTAGVYTYASQDVDKIHDATARGVTCTDAAMGVQIDVQAHESVAITALGAGGRKVSVGHGSRGSVTIYIHDLYAGEHKSFLVYLTVPEGVEEKERLLTVTGLFRDSESSDEASPLDAIDVSVLRPEHATPTDETICPDVAPEFEEKKEAMEVNKVQDMPADIQEQVVKTPFPAKQQPEKVSKQEEKGTVETITIWRGQYYALCAALLLLLGVGAAMLVMSKKAEDCDGKGHGTVDISRHPGWSKMEESLGLAMVKKMEEDASIASFLHGASVKDMSRTLVTYINLDRIA